MKELFKKITIAVMSVMVLAGAAAATPKVMAQQIAEPGLKLVETVKDTERKQIIISPTESISLGEVYGVMGGMVVIGAIVEVACVHYVLRRKD